MPEPSNAKSTSIEIISPPRHLAKPLPVLSAAEAEEMAESSIDFRRLIRRYCWLFIVLAALGAIGGFVSIILATPLYRSRLLLDIQPVRNGRDVNRSDEEATFQTQMILIRSGGFLKRVADRMQAESLPVAPVRTDFFTKLRTKLRPEMRNSTQLMADGIQSAISTLLVRPVNGTTLLEISCESIHPELAASFVNTVGSEFIDQSLQSRAIDSQRSSQYMNAQVEETKAKLKEAEDKLQDFVRQSGNLFVQQDNTLADSNVRMFQSQMATAATERMSKQAQYDQMKNASPERRAELLQDQNLGTLRQRLIQLRQDRLVLTARFTPNHQKVQSLDLQIQDTEQALRKEADAAWQRYQLDFEATQKREKLMGSAYYGAAGQLSSQASQAAQYSALRREVDILRQTYGQILMQAGQNSIMNSLPQNNMRIIDMASVNPEPLRPKPMMNLAFGTMLGLMAGVGIVFIRERTDRSLKQPGAARELLNARELGVIPNLNVIEAPLRNVRVRIALQKSSALIRTGLQRTSSNSGRELIGWQQKTFLSESFRHTVASLLREDSPERRLGVLLFTSPNPSEGKSMISANLGISLAETGRKVLVIDADFRRPRQHELFGLPNTGGFSTVLQEAAADRPFNVLDYVQTSHIPGLHLLVNGPAPDNLHLLLHSRKLGEILDELRGSFDMILIDAPPVLQIADARTMNLLADGVVLVLRSGVTDRKSALEAYRYLQEDGAQILGTILNDWRPSRNKVDHYYNYVRSSPGDNAEQEGQPSTGKDA